MTLFGLFAVSAMLVIYALEQRNSRIVLAFAGACGLASIYASLQARVAIRRVGGWAAVAVRGGMAG